MVWLFTLVRNSSGPDPLRLSHKVHTDRALHGALHMFALTDFSNAARSNALCKGLARLRMWGRERRKGASKRSRRYVAPSGPYGSQDATRFSEITAGKPTPKASAQRAACHDRLWTADCRCSQRAARKHEAMQLTHARGRHANAWHATPDASGRWWCPRAQARFAVAPDDCRARRC